MADEKSEKKFQVMLLDDESIERLEKSVNKVIDLIQGETKVFDEQAFILRVLIETFEETQNAVVPFKDRYTDPSYIYHDSGLDENRSKMKQLSHQAKMFCLHNNMDVGTERRALIFGFVKWLENIGKNEIGKSGDPE